MLKGKAAIVTGGGRGIGRAIALKLAENGADIVINEIPSADYAEQTAEEIRALGVRALTVYGDVRSTEDTKRLADTAVAELGRIDILVNNAGVTRDSLLLRMSEEAWDTVLDINLKGAFNCIKAVSRAMMKQKGGAIVNIASVVGEMGNVGQANYAASKGGLIALTKTVAKELARKGIRANAVAPGFVRSAMTDTLADDVKAKYFDAIPAGRFAEAEDIAAAVLFLAGDGASYITGQVINVDGGLLM